MEPVWGEHLHLGLFEGPLDPLRDAQERAVRAMADDLLLSPDSTVLEVACGLGPAARHLADRYGCRVFASNISGLGERVAFLGADFHRLPFADGCFDLWWCQESLLHSPDKAAVLAEATRMLRPEGWLVLSDVTLARWVGEADREAIYARVKSPGMWDRSDYDRALAALGFEVVRFEDWSPHVAPSYAAIRAAAVAHLERHPVGLPAVETDHALAQFQLWVEAAEAGKIGWHYYTARRAG
jgi:sarcosine/dimethylglycine N-methyltransferase